MPSITIKNIPPGLHEKLKQSAARNHRSLNREIIACLEQAAGHSPAGLERLLAEAGRLRKMTAAVPVTGEFFRRAKQEGRP